MRRSDILRQQSINRQTRERQETSKIPQQNQPDNTNQVGMAMVIDAIKFGKGYVCTLEVLSNGKATGIRYENAMAYGPVTIGSVASFARHPNGTIEIINSSSTSSTTNNTTVTNNVPIHSHQNIYSGGAAGFLSGTL